MNVAVTPISAPPAVPVRPSLRMFSVDDYHKMISAGVLAEDDPVELLEGWVVLKMPRNPKHDTAVTLVTAALQKVAAGGMHVRTQSAITTEDSEPEPDVVLVNGDVRAYAARHPGGGDVVVLVEVAESSLPHDREVKGRVYSRAGVSCYWIVNLVDSVVEVYEVPSGPAAAPTFASKQQYATGQTIPLKVGTGVVQVAVSDLLP